MKRIRLNESQFNRLVSKCVKRVIKEEESTDKEIIIKRKLLSFKKYYDKANEISKAYLYFVFEDNNGNDIARSSDDSTYSFEELFEDMEYQQIDFSQVAEVIFEIWFDQVEDEYGNYSGDDELFIQKCFQV